MSGYRWADDRTLEVKVREGERFPDGEPLTAATVKRSFDEQMRWAAPHPPGTQFNPDPRTRCEVVDDRRQQAGAGRAEGRGGCATGTRRQRRGHGLSQ